VDQKDHLTYFNTKLQHPLDLLIVQDLLFKCMIMFHLDILFTLIVVHTAQTYCKN